MDSNSETSYTELARIYGFDPTPESVVRLTQLVARRDSDLEEIAGLINEDPSLRKRLLRAANPGVRSESAYRVATVEEALMRNGVGCALLMAMGAPLALALIKTFRTMLNLKLDAVDSESVPALDGDHILGIIRFSGKAVGKVSLRLSYASASQIAGLLVGLPPRELNAGQIYDTVGELLNIITGNFKSNLSDAGLECRLDPPRVTRVSGFPGSDAAGAGLERMTFKAGQLVLFVDASVNPWSGG
jgi:CheY-specific phosphatase CheX